MPLGKLLRPSSILLDLSLHHPPGIKFQGILVPEPFLDGGTSIREPNGFSSVTAVS